MTHTADIDASRGSDRALVAALRDRWGNLPGERHAPLLKLPLALLQMPDVAYGVIIRLYDASVRHWSGKSGWV